MDSSSIELGLAVLVAGSLAFFGLGTWILSPIDRAARQVHGPLKFTIADFLCLFFTVQIPLSLVAWLRTGGSDEAFWVLTTLAWVAGPLIWYTGARAISRAGIVHGRGRLLFMGGVIPLVYYGLLPFTYLAAAAVFRIAETGDPWQPFRYGGATLLGIVLGAALIGCGLVTRRLVRPSDRPLRPVAAE